MKDRRSAETAEKKTLGILGELCVLCGKTAHCFARSEGGRHEPLTYPIHLAQPTQTTTQPIESVSDT